MDWNTIKALMKSRKMLKESERRGKEFQALHGRPATKEEAEVIAWEVLAELGVNVEELKKARDKGI